ncbi:MAG: HAD-IIIC family phosphatase [Lachnospiraceae bacterium]|nr:HAD-IIIC family phosphatase [Lachnospiraceae bacterium]
MRELQYPFDADYILKKKKALKRQLSENTDGFLPVRIAILGGYTTNDIRLILELFLLDQRFIPEFYESEYARFYEDAIFDNTELTDFHPDIVYVCTSNRNIPAYPSAWDDTAAVDSLLHDQSEKFVQIWESLTERYDCPIIQNNFELPSYRLLGNMDASDIHGRVNFITRLNMEFYSYAQTHKNLHICDINYLSAVFGLDRWSDPFYYHMYKYALSLDAIPYLAFNVANIIKSIYGKNKKGLVLDMDNTLWGGVIGDDGADNILIGPEEPEGRAFTEFQTYLKELSSLGILLNVDSKNDEANALAGLSHPDSVLKEDDFIVIKANWEPKDRNLTEIAQTLNILPESLVFIDDNPAERHIVTSSMPQVCAPEIGEPHEYIGTIDKGGYFEATSLSSDDAKRNEMYRENAKRVTLQSKFTDYRDYLLSLDMHAHIGEFEPVAYGRITQLTNKSNQFNLTTKRYTQNQIESAASDPDRIAIYGRLTDRFGDNGIVTVVIGHVQNDECHIELWLMSCRVLKRDMEYAMMDALAKECNRRGLSKIIGYYYSTAKNAMVKDFYADMGFTLTNEDPDGNRVWEYELGADYECKNSVIKVDM